MAVILFCVFAIVEFLLFLRPNIYSYKYNYVKKHANTLNVIIFGNSHMEESLIPDTIGKSIFNFAISGRRIEYDLALAQKFIPQMNHLKYVVVPFDYSSFSNSLSLSNEDMESPMDKTFSCMYYKYMNIKMGKPIWYWSEICSSKLKFMARFLESDSKCRECDSLGFVKLSLNNRLPDWEHRMMITKADKPLIYDKSKMTKISNIYNEIAYLTKQKGAKLILISTPLYKTNREIMDLSIMNKMKVFANELNEKYKNVEYFDYTFDTDFKDEDFFDSSHLSEFGAKKMSLKLKKGLKL